MTGFRKENGFLGISESNPLARHLDARSARGKDRVLRLKAGARGARASDDDDATGPVQQLW